MGWFRTQNLAQFSLCFACIFRSTVMPSVGKFTSTSPKMKLWLMKLKTWKHRKCQTKCCQPHLVDFCKMVNKLSYAANLCEKIEKIVIDYWTNKKQDNSIKKIKIIWFTAIYSNLVRYQILFKVYCHTSFWIHLVRKKTQLSKN